MNLAGVSPTPTKGRRDRLPRSVARRRSLMPSRHPAGPDLRQVVAWYDNEYGYTCNMLRMVERLQMIPGRSEHRFDHPALSES